MTMTTCSECGTPIMWVPFNSLCYECNEIVERIQEGKKTMSKRTDSTLLYRVTAISPSGKQRTIDFRQLWEAKSNGVNFLSKSGYNDIQLLAWNADKGAYEPYVEKSNGSAPVQKDTLYNPEHVLIVESLSQKVQAFKRIVRKGAKPTEMQDFAITVLEALDELGINVYKMLAAAGMEDEEDDYSEGDEDN